MILKHWVSGHLCLLPNVILDNQTSLLPLTYILINLGFISYWFWLLSLVQIIIKMREYT